LAGLTVPESKILLATAIALDGCISQFYSKSKDRTVVTTYFFNTDFSVIRNVISAAEALAIKWTLYTRRRKRKQKREYILYLNSAAIYLHLYRVRHLIPKAKWKRLEDQYDYADLRKRYLCYMLIQQIRDQIKPREKMKTARLLAESFHLPRQTVLNWIRKVATPTFIVV